MIGSSDAAHRLRWAVRSRLPRAGLQQRRFDRETYHALFSMRVWRPDDLIVDVGANDGRTVQRLRRYLPPTRIFALEPVSGTYEVLKARTAKLRDVTCFRLALGAEEGERPIFVGDVPALNSFYPSFQGTTRSEVVRVSTLDRFLDAQGVGRVQLLKIDTEGHDLEVLRGAAMCLDTGRIDVIQVEVGFDVPGVDQPSLEMVRSYLLERRYHLWGIYNQCRGAALSTRDRPGAPQILTYCDALFVHAGATTRTPAA